MENTQLQTTEGGELVTAQVPLRIPESHVPSIRKILQLSDASTDQLITALSSLTVATGPLATSKQIRDQVPGISFEDLNEIMKALYVIYEVRDVIEYSPGEFLNALIEGIRINSGFDLKEHGNLLHLRERLQKLLDISGLYTVAKAMKLQRNGERLYCDAVILSDIRPVFGDDVKSRPTGALITHTLKIGYHEEGEHKEVFLVLDEEDLVSLQEVIKRAQSKGETLDTLLQEMKLPRLGR